MSKPQATPAPAHATSSISIFLTNLHLLDLDRCEDWPAISAQTFTSKNTLQNEKNRIHCVEWAFYRLFELWDLEETKDKLLPFFPPLEPLQSLNLRAALFRCINELKKNGDLGKEVIIRKTMFDDCKGEKLQELLASFSTIVLRKILAAGQTGKKSIAGQLAIARRITSEEHESLLPLAVAHPASLTALLRKKESLRTKYRKFGSILDTKEQELDYRFEKVVETQSFLDENPIPDHTVSRLSAMFEKHWQGESKLIDVIVQGEEHSLGDSLLDRQFQQVWPEISEGSFHEEIGTMQQGLLQDLEKRVAEQEARLKQWRDFKDAMKTDNKLRISPKKQEIPLMRTTGNDEDRLKRRERDLVFSPRKSPRKSDWELEPKAADSSPTPAMPKTTKANIKLPRSASKQISPSKEEKVKDETSVTQNRRSTGLVSPVGGGQDDSDDSGFSEVSGSQLHELASPDAIRVIDEDALSRASKENNDKSHAAERAHASGVDRELAIPPSPARKPLLSPTNGESPKIRDEKGPVQRSSIGYDREESYTDSQELDEDDLLAEQIVSMTINAAPTPKQPQLSLEQRTRQSIAFASPRKFQGLQSEALPQTLPPPTAKEDPSHAQPSGPNTLLERTRKSISLLPPKSKPSRKSIHERRTSKMYPTNQFETPKKQLSSVRESTSPDLLFSPGAGYDDVFKSRPKIANSPTPSPAPWDGLERGHGDDLGGEGESPLLRIISNV
ncbi:hypothetical protein N7G274_006911 [Stereocaulon virgatum]|uniref:HAUS augmin-like complex subunit 6 N-terminal domain-containing protein n=1 Tax=Stereocaulon virgatum TaxID=373712 RepID=A0ABR4A464_9LECA